MNELDIYKIFYKTINEGFDSAYENPRDFAGFVNGALCMFDWLQRDLKEKESSK